MAEKTTVLSCARCGAPLKGLSTDSGFLCRGCGAGWVIGEEGLEPVTASVRTDEGTDLPLPFWQVDARVSVASRITRREHHGVPLRRGRWFSPSRETGLSETGGFSGERRLVIPAFSVNGIFNLAVRLTARIDRLPGERAGGPWPRLAGLFSGIREVPELARGVCVGQEASGPDWLADVALTVEVRATELLVLPAALLPETVTLQGPGVSFFRRNMPDLKRIIAFHQGSPVDPEPCSI
jgi:hypothetical protein